MSYNFCSTIVSFKDAPAPALATRQPKSSAQGANLISNNNTPENNAAEGEANNFTLAITISISDLQVIKQRIEDLEEAAKRNSFCRQ